MFNKKKNIKIIIEYPYNIKREYWLTDHIAEKVMDGTHFTIKSQHPKFSETFEVSLEEDKDERERNLCSYIRGKTGTLLEI